VDRGLIEAARRGDRDAYATVATQSSDRLYAVALRTLRDPDAARDALQVALVRIWRDLSTLRDVDRYEAWSYRVLVNCCREQRRAVSRIVDRIDDRATDPGADDHEARFAEHDELERAFGALTIDQRMTVVLHYYRDLPVAEVAATLGISEGTVKSRLHAARKALRAAIDADARVAMPRERTA
jgi:RNA polymerase sigma-70 factor (ECF subfamily)